MKKLITLLAVFLVFGFKHPFYLGVCELKYNNSERVLQGSVKLFVNDLEDALTKLNGAKVDLMNIKDSVATGALLKTYLHQRLSFVINDKKAAYHYIGFEQDQEAMWIYIEVLNCPKPNKITVTNTLLYDFLKQQMNIVQVEVGADKKSSKVVNPEKELSFEF
ncbi:MAG: hypothetical protein IT236_03050 [Bacteroidia bacterium]|nr:hypothetical protein [Bacteroidia bacterium]